MTEHTVTIPTRDHGDVTIPEPAWCTGEHPAGGYRVDISHYGPGIEATTTTSRGVVPLLEMSLAQNPFTDDAAAVTVAVHLDGDYYRHDVNGLDRLADDLVEAARRVRLMRQRLAIETGPHRLPQPEPGAVLAQMARRLAEAADAGRAPWDSSGDRQVTSQQAVGDVTVRLTAEILTPPTTASGDDQ